MKNEKEESWNKSDLKRILCSEDISIYKSTINKIVFVSMFS
jgi:hypothetical protein